MEREIPVLFHGGPLDGTRRPFTLDVLVQMGGVIPAFAPDEGDLEVDDSLRVTRAGRIANYVVLGVPGRWALDGDADAWEFSTIGRWLPDPVRLFQLVSGAASADAA